MAQGQGTPGAVRMGTDKDAVPVHAATLQQAQDGAARRDALPMGRGRVPAGETHDKRDKGKVREGEEGAGAGVIRKRIPLAKMESSRRLSAFLCEPFSLRHARP